MQQAYIRPAFVEVSEVFDRNAVVSRGLPFKSLRVDIDRIFVARRSVLNRPSGHELPQSLGSVLLFSGREMSDSLLKNDALGEKLQPGCFGVDLTELGNPAWTGKLKNDGPRVLVAGLRPIVDALRYVHQRARPDCLSAIEQVAL